MRGAGGRVGIHATADRAASGLVLKFQHPAKGAGYIAHFYCWIAGAVHDVSALDDIPTQIAVLECLVSEFTSDDTRAEYPDLDGSRVRDLSGKQRIVLLEEFYRSLGSRLSVQSVIRGQDDADASHLVPVHAQVLFQEPQKLAEHDLRGNREVGIGGRQCHQLWRVHPVERGHIQVGQDPDEEGLHWPPARG